MKVSEDLKPPRGASMGRTTRNRGKSRKYRTAELWLEVWAENLHLRKSASLGSGIGDHGKYRPEDDPHKSSWVQAQIETVLANIPPLEARIAYEVYYSGRSIREIGRELGSHHKARSLHERLLRQVHRRVEWMRELSISEAAARQAIETGEFDTPGWTEIVKYLEARKGHLFRVCA